MTKQTCTELSYLSRLSPTPTGNVHENGYTVAGSIVFITGTFGIYALGQTGETPGNKRPDSPADAGNSAFSQCEESASSFPPFVALRLAGSKNGLTGKVEEEEEEGGGGEQAQEQDEMGAEDASLGIEAGSGDVDTGS